MNTYFKNTVLFILVIYAIHLLNIALGMRLNQFGLIPRTINGLPGIVTSALLHANWQHLFSNTVPLFIFLLLLKVQVEKSILPIILGVVVMGGTLVWFFGRQSIHIGASGLIYGLATFLTIYGFRTKKPLAWIISISVILLYGGMIWGVLPTRSYISWEAHLFGAIAGGILGYKKKITTSI